MLIDERKAAVDSLTDDELDIEVARGRTSRFQEELFDYARVRQQARRDAEQAAADKAALDVAKANVRVAEQAVKVAEQSRTGTHLGWVAAVLVGVATIVATCHGGM